MVGRSFALAAAAALIGTAAETAACDLKLQPSPIFGGACNVLVGYHRGQRVGPFHIRLSDGSFATVGSCEGYVPVRSVAGNDVTVEAFHTVPPAVYTLADDCRSATKNPVR